MEGSSKAQRVTLTVSEKTLSTRHPSALRAGYHAEFRGVRGTVEEVRGQEAKVKDEKSGIIKTIYLPKEHIPLAPGMRVEINGSWRPFSLAIDAETILKLDK